MLRIALRMVIADRAKFVGLLFGLAFTSFLVTFAAGYFCGFMTSGFALVSENPQVDVWVMDPAVESAEQTTNMPASAVERVRSVEGVADARGLWLSSADVRLANGRFQPFQLIAVDDATLAGAPRAGGVALESLRGEGAAIVDAGGTEGKLLTPARRADQWPHDGARLDVPMRDLRGGDEVLVNDRPLRILGISSTLPRFPPRPLLYLTRGNALGVLPGERRNVTFVLVRGVPGIDASMLANRITARTALKARTAADFKADTVRWYLINSEDVGDISAMLILAMTMGLGVSGVMLYMFTYDHRRDYAVLKALGAEPRLLATMVIAQTAVCALLGACIGLGIAGVAGELAARVGFPFRLLWYTPLAGLLAVLIVACISAAVSLGPIRRVAPADAFAA